MFCVFLKTDMPAIVDVYDQVILDEQTVSNPEHFQLVKKRTN